MLEIIKVPNPALNESADEIDTIDKATAELAGEMINLMIKEKGIGLAAPQVNLNKRLFVVSLQGDTPRIFINPQIIETSLEETEMEEGCLSIPGIYTDIKRPAAVRVQAWNERGRPFTLEADGILARVIQHEFDHLQGVLFVDYLQDRKREKVMKKYLKTAGAR
ncbi:MAG: peptide deformylase [Spirochaetia bacterium]